MRRAAGIVSLIGLFAAGCSSSAENSAVDTTAADTTAGSSTTIAVTTAPTDSTAVAVETAFESAVVERSADGTLTIAWDISSDDPVQVSWGTDPDAFPTVLDTVEGTNSVTISDPAPGGRAYFRLSAGGAGVTVAERRLELAGVHNFRDLGGYETEDRRRVRWGQVFRSGALYDLTDDDLGVVSSLGIRLVCDFRSDTELAAEPDPQFGAEAVRLSVNDESVDVQAITNSILAGDLDSISPDLLLEGMPKIATDFGELWGQLLTRVSDPGNRPTNVHCTAGKDRAGWAAAMLLRALGVPAQTVMEDYLLSNTYLAASNEETIAQVRTIVAGVKGIPEAEVDMSNLVALLDVRAEYLQAAFDAVDARFGSFENYLIEGLGLTEGQLDELRSELLED